MTILIYIHGISTVGKSYIGNEIVKVLSSKEISAIVIDQDTYFKQHKPTVCYTDNHNNTYKSQNFDTLDAVDFSAFSSDIISAMSNYMYVIVTGFAMWSGVMRIKPDMSILLSYGMTNEEVIFQVIKTRRISKRLTMDKYTKDEWMVRKVVWPFYEKTLENIIVDKVISIYDINKDSGRHQRTKSHDIVQQILDIENEKACRL